MTREGAPSRFGFLRSPSALSAGVAQEGYRRLTFVPATRPDAAPQPPGLNFVVLNEPQEPQQQVLVTHSGMPPGAPGPGPPRHLHAAKSRELFKEEDVALHWSERRRPGAGLQNLGNTCFMNSVLQCLTHTPPLAEAVLAGLVPIAPRSETADLLTITAAHIKRALGASSKVIAPTQHAARLRLVNRRFRLGRQEDSHEYLRCLLDAMHEVCLKPFKPQPPPELAATTLISRVFGGKLCSRIVCPGVGYESCTYEDFLDLSLEITRAPSLVRALQHFTAREVLDGNNKYRCPKNNKLVRAEKQITIDAAPNVLTIHFKRFQYGGYGSKITKHVEFGTEVNLQHFMSKPTVGPQVYELYGVLVHLGHSVHSGHYYCFVRAGNGLWHKCDDTQIGQCSERTVLAQNAYILFYVRRHPRGDRPLQPRGWEESQAANGGQAWGPHPAPPSANGGPPAGLLTSQQRAIQQHLQGRAAAHAGPDGRPLANGDVPAKRANPTPLPLPAPAPSTANGGSPAPPDADHQDLQPQPTPAMHGAGEEVLHPPADGGEAGEGVLRVRASRTGSAIPLQLTSLGRMLQGLTSLRPRRHHQDLLLKAKALTALRHTLTTPPPDTAEPSSRATGQAQQEASPPQPEQLPPTNGEKSAAGAGLSGSRRLKRAAAAGVAAEEDGLGPVPAGKRAKKRGTAPATLHGNGVMPHGGLDGPSSPDGDEQQLVGAAAAAALMGGFSGRGNGGPSGIATTRWGYGDMDDPIAQAASRLMRAGSSVLANGKRVHDEWDEEYDRGKVKKVRLAGAGM